MPAIAAEPRLLVVPTCPELFSVLFVLFKLTAVEFGSEVYGAVHIRLRPYTAHKVAGPRRR